MNPPTVIAPQPSQVAPVSAAPELSDTLSQALYDLIARQPFFKGLNSHQLQLLTDSALEMKFETRTDNLCGRKPGQSVLSHPGRQGGVESETEQRGVMIPIQTLGPGDDLGWSWLFPPYSLHFSARALETTKTIFFYGPRLREQCEQDHEMGYQIMKRIAEVATQSLGATQRQLMKYIDKNTPEKP